MGIAFDVFRPSAGVRFLALGRNGGALSGERLLTPWTRRCGALARLRVRVFVGPCPARRGCAGPPAQSPAAAEPG